MALTFQIKTVDGVCVMGPEGRIVIGNEVGALRDKIRELLSAGHTNFLVNLSGVSYMDSTGVGALVGSFTTIRGRGGQMKLSNLSQRTKDLLIMTKLLTVFDVFDNELDGIKSFATKG